MAEMGLMEIVSSLSHAVVARLEDALSNSVIDTYGNCAQSKIPFYPILLTFLICNKHLNTQLNEKCVRTLPNGSKN